MATTLPITITHCFINNAGNIVVVYSDAGTTAQQRDFGDLTKFKVESPPGKPVIFPTGTNAIFQIAVPATVITLPPGSTPPISSGAIFQVTAPGITAPATGGLQEPIATLKTDFDQKVDAATGAVTGVSGAIGDATSFPFLTEQVSFSAPGPATSSPGGGTSSLAQTVGVALQQVLGWKVRDDDPKGFIGALTQSFACKEVEGHVECTWTPRSYAVQTDLAGGITGAQASIYARAKDAVDQSVPLLDGLYPLRADDDKEFIEAARSVVRTHMTAIVEELGIPGGPRPSRVDQLFILLLGVLTANPDPDSIRGELAQLRAQLGLRLRAGTPTDPGAGTSTNPEPGNLGNSVDDEQDQTNFRIVVDYLTSLRQSWENNRQFFTRTVNTSFLGTQLVLLSRQLSVVAETVDEVRFTLDSVFIGPSERQTFPVILSDETGATTNIFVEEFLTWVYAFASNEGPQLVQEGGKFAVGTSFLPIAIRLQAMAVSLVAESRARTGGFHTARVQRSLEELAAQIQVLVDQARLVPPSPF